jgi:tryptophan 2,3-dioxygenase
VTIVDDSTGLTYKSYLAIDEILAMQRPVSREHDEMLFIVVHQIHELWFKQLLHEFAKLQGELTAGHTTNALVTLRRVLTIVKAVVAQIDVIETLSPHQFAAFRDCLGDSSGSQSSQFREIEAALGRRANWVFERYPEGSAERHRIESAMTRPCVFDSFVRYLFAHGYAVPLDRLHRDVSLPLAASEELQQVLLRIYQYDGAAAQICERLVDLDHGIQEWRYRHVKMVERMIGLKAGTGGSSGAAYLRETLFRPLFPDLAAVRGGF